MMNEEMKYAWGRFVGYRDGWEKEFDAWLQQVKDEAYETGWEEGQDFVQSMSDVGF